MNLIPLLVVAVAVLPVVSLAAWVWLVTARTSKELESLDFDGMHFEE